MDNGLLICRCQEVTEAEIKAAIADGATTVDGVKRRTRAGMGLCQGLTCGKLVQGIVARELGVRPNELEQNTARTPARPVEMSVYGNEIIEKEAAK